MSNPVCIICDEKLNISQSTTCPYCQFESCRTCVRKYVLSENEPKCMNCKKCWTREHQNTILLQSFVNKQLRTHLEKVMYEREMALFPATMEIIEDRRLMEKLNYERCAIKEHNALLNANASYQDRMIKENKKRLSMCKTMPKMFPDLNVEELKHKITRSQEIYDECIEKLKQLSTNTRIGTQILRMTPEQRKIVMSNYVEGADPNDVLNTIMHFGQTEDTMRRNHPRFIRACPVETCRGYLNQNWKCGLCSVVTCSKCNIPLEKTTVVSDEEGNQYQEPEHVCKPDDVATAELLAKDTRPCPQCGTGIFKIDGCDQMWCTECRTAFSWVTGQIETGHVHNPHYFEYQRRNGNVARNILDIPCNDIRTDAYHGIIYHLMSLVIKNREKGERENRGLLPLTQENINYLRELRTKYCDYAISLHNYAEQILPRYRPDAIKDNLELRVKYLTEQYDMNEFKHALSRDSKQFNRNIEIGQVLQTVIFGMSDIFNRLIDYLRRHTSQKNDACGLEPIFGMDREFDSLMEYANECLENVCKQYKLTRIALFVREISKHNLPGLFTVKEEKGKLIPKRLM